ncbi:MAG: hypothetical protein WD278_17760 [Pirellulales bacterium]
MSTDVSRDLEHLKILSILHYVFGGLTLAGSCFGLIYVFMGIAMVASPEAFEGPDAPPAAIGWGLAAFGFGCSLAGWIVSGCVILAGRYLARRVHRTFCLVVAAIICLSVPLGTLLGVFTLITLSRPSVKALFDEQEAIGRGMP